MLGAPLLPRTAPFSTEQISALNAVMSGISPAQRSWLSGFLAGYESAATPVAAPAAAPRAKVPLTILFATESGNAEALAGDAKKAAARLGFAAEVVDMAEADPAEIAKKKNLLVVASTWGEGDPPERAVEFYTSLMSKDAPRFENVRFAVLALGDTAYVNFCATGKAIDARLAELGARRIADRIDCDLDYAKPAAAWIGSTLGTLDELTREADAPAVATVIDFPATTSAYGKDNPFPAEVTEAINLNGSRSGKETIHLELSVEGSGLTWEPGDALGLQPRNDPAMLEGILEAVGLGGDDALKARLETERDVTSLTRPVIEAYAKLTADARIAELSETDFAKGRQIIDLLEAFPHKLEPQELESLLRPLPARLYSIASSAKATPDEVHLLLAAVRYRSHERDRQGVCSTYVADRLGKGKTVPVHVKPNKHFRLPADPKTPIVMIGPGTGVAPFRAFVQEREAVGAPGGGFGKSWLFFGDRSYTHDFLYQLDWQDHLKSGALGRIDVAFSRDQPEKVYVQHRMWDRRADLFAWLEEGAHLYVCGDEKAMAKDVHATLRRIVEDRSGRDAEAAESWLADLKRAGRYQRDVY